MFYAVIVAMHIFGFAVLGGLAVLVHRRAPYPWNSWSVIVPLILAGFCLAFLLIMPHALFPR
jgi:hypothetical protein